jgi:hypothetical protein
MRNELLNAALEGELFGNRMKVAFTLSDGAVIRGVMVIREITVSPYDTNYGLNMQPPRSVEIRATILPSDAIDDDVTELLAENDINKLRRIRLQRQEGL